MEIKEKLAMIEECMDLEAGTLKKDDELERFDEWDSVAALSIIAAVDEHFHKNISGEELKNAKTVADILALME